MAQVNLKTTLTQHLRYLHLPGIRECFEETARKAEKESLSYERYLLELVERESEVRRHNRIQRFLRESKLLLEKLQLPSCRCTATFWLYSTNTVRR